MLTRAFSCSTHILGFKMLIVGLGFALYFMKLLAGILLHGFVYDRRYYGKYSENISSKQEIDTNYNMPFIHEEFIKNEENPDMFQRK